MLATYWYLVTDHLYMDNMYLLYGIVNTGIYTERNNALHGRNVWPHAHVRLIKAIFSWSCSGRLISSLPNRMSLYHITLVCNPAREPSLISNTWTKNLVFRNHLSIPEFLKIYPSKNFLLYGILQSSMQKVLGLCGLCQHIIGIIGVLKYWA